MRDGPTDQPVLGPCAQERVARFWADLFGTSREPPTASPWVVAHGADLTGYPGALVVVREDRVLISAPPDLVGRLPRWGPAPPAAVAPSWWRGQLAGWRVLGPSVHSFTDRLPGPAAVDDQPVVGRARGRDLEQLRASGW